MMNESLKHNDDEEVKKLLRALPKVQASNDFDVRLQKKIAQGRSKKRVIEYILSHPVPSFAYSLLVVVMLASVWYYAYVSYFKESVPEVVEPTEHQERWRGQQPDTLRGKLEGGDAVERQGELSGRSSLQDEVQDDVSSVTSATGANADVKMKAPSHDQSSEKVDVHVTTKDEELQFRQKEAEKIIGVQPLMKGVEPQTVPEFPVSMGAKTGVQDSSALQDSLLQDSLRQVKQFKKKIQQQKAKKLDKK